MKIFSDFDVYDHKYTYDEMKVMSLLPQVIKELEDDKDSSIELCCEDLMRICEAVYAHWIDGRDISEGEKYQKYPWLEIKGFEEDGYIQAYAGRVLPYFVELYLEEFKNV